MTEIAHNVLILKDESIILRKSRKGCADLASNGTKKRDVSLHLLNTNLLANHNLCDFITYVYICLTTLQR